jgi:hypothetical protein
MKKGERMAQYTKLANLIELGSTIYDEEIEYITKELEETGNDPEQLEKEILLMLKKAKAEIKVEKGKKLSEEFRSVISRMKKFPDELLNQKPELAAAYRKLNDAGNVDSEDVLDDDEKMIILEFLKSKL